VFTTFRPILRLSKDYLTASCTWPLYHIILSLCISIAAPPRPMSLDNTNAALHRFISELGTKYLEPFGELGLDGRSTSDTALDCVFTLQRSMHGNVYIFRFSGPSTQASLSGQRPTVDINVTAQVWDDRASSSRQVRSIALDLASQVEPPGYMTVVSWLSDRNAQVAAVNPSATHRKQEEGDSIEGSESFGEDPDEVIDVLY